MIDVIIYPHKTLRYIFLVCSQCNHCSRRMFELIRGDYKPFIALEESAQERELLAFEPPAKGTAWQKMLQVGSSWVENTMVDQLVHGLSHHISIYSGLMWFIGT